MSASQEKKRRQGAVAEGPTKSQIAAEKERKENKSFRIKTIIVCVLLVLFIAAVVVLNSNLLYTVPTAIQIGDVGYSAAEYSYFYHSGYYSFVNTYGDYVSYLLDTSQPLDEQMYSDQLTWADYFHQSAQTSMQQITMLYEEGVANGFALTEEEAAEIDESFASMEESYATYGYSSLNNYLEGAYGKGCTEKTMRKLMEMSYIADDYAEYMSDSFTYTNEDLEAYYQENADTYDKISYRTYYFDGSAVEADEENGIEAVDADTAMAEAQANAEAFAAAVTDEVSFADLAYEYADEADKTTYTDEDATLNTVAGSNLSSAYSEWLLDAARKDGDVTALESTNGWYVVMFVSRDDNHYATKNVRHILVKAVADSDGNYTDEALATAKEKAENILAQWEEGTADEEFFATLANANSEDTGSNTNGGLYENVYKGQMVTEFDAFCFADHEEGDTAIVYGESSSYAGYHIIYYIGDGVLYSDYLAETDKRTEDYNDWQTAELEAYPITEKSAASLAD